MPRQFFLTLLVLSFATRSVAFFDLVPFVVLVDLGSLSPFRRVPLSPLSLSSCSPEPLEPLQVVECGVEAAFPARLDDSVVEEAGVSNEAAGEADDQGLAAVVCRPVEFARGGVAEQAEATQQLPVGDASADPVDMEKVESLTLPTC